jgi:hypothetical protein
MIEAYRTDRTSAEAVVGMFEALHKRLLRRWWRRLLLGQPTVALEVHHTTAQPASGVVGHDDPSRGRLCEAQRDGLGAGSSGGVGPFAWLAARRFTYKARILGLSWDSEPHRTTPKTPQTAITAE